MRRQFETVETAEGTRYLLDGKEICHVVGCELELLSAKHSRYLMTLKVAVAIVLSILLVFEFPQGLFRKLSGNTKNTCRDSSAG